MRMKNLILLLPASLFGLSFAYAAGPVQETAAGRDGEDRLAPVTLRADVDLDGRVDLLLIHPSGSAALYRDVDGTLEPSTQAFGPSGLPPLRSAAFGDLDLDGAPDLFVVTRSGEALLFAGDGAGAFTDVTASAGLALSAPVLGGRWDDIDRDGRPDLVIATATGFSIARNLGDGLVEVQSLAHQVATSSRAGIIAENPPASDPAPGPDRPGRVDSGGRSTGASTGRGNACSVPRWISSCAGATRASAASSASS